MHTKSNGLGASASSASQALSREFNSFLADVEDLVKETAALGGDELAQTRARLSKRISAARDSIGELGDNLAEQGRRTATATNDYVHEQPWKVIGASAAAAFLLGFVLARRS